MARLVGWVFARYGSRVIEPQLNGAITALFLLMWLGDRARAMRCRRSSCPAWHRPAPSSVARSSSRH
jgi:hypothetical protein